MKTPPSLIMHARVEWLETRIAPAAAVLDLSALDGTNGFAVNGAAAGDLLGSSAVGIGDINGDSFPDFAIGAPLADDAAARNSGRLAVVFGRTSGLPANLNIDELDGTNGFVVVGEEFGDEAGFSVSAGDVNGDGLDDLIIGAPYGTGALSGIVYIVKGRATFPKTLYLSPGTEDIRIFGEGQSDFAGFSVSTAGDFNKDGKDDILIGAKNALGQGLTASAGAAYVLFGAKEMSNFVNLSELTSASGFKVQGDASMDFLGTSVSSAGDFNNDGYDDVVIGASGSAYVIFGRESIGGPVLLSALNGSNGFRINGGAAGDLAGISISAAGDLNNDSIDDLIVGAPGADTNGQDSGGAYVIYGRSGDFPVSALNLSSVAGSTGFKIQGEAAGDMAGASVARAGDFNRDGLQDLVIGAPGWGAAYVLLATSAGFADVVNLANVTETTAIRLQGSVTEDATGNFVAAAGDVNGDGFADLIVGANRADPNGAMDAGRAYVVYGIRNANTVPTISIDDVSANEGSAGTPEAKFTVRLSEASSKPVSVNYASANGTAIAPSDYTAVSLGTLTFNPGEIIKTVTVVVAGDNLAESAETFFVNLSNATNAIIEDAQGRGTILNDDEAVLSIANAARLEGDAGTAPLSFVIRLSNPSELPISVLVSTTDGSATSGSDFTAVSDQLVEFAPGETIKTIDVTIFGDTEVEQNEEFTIGLSNATNAQSVNGFAQGMIVGDDSDVVINPIAGGSGVVFTDAAGDEVKVTLSKGSLSEANVILGADGNIVLIDLGSLAASGQGLATFGNATLKVSAHSVAGGNGLVNVGAINLGNTSVKNIVINGGLGNINAGKVTIQQIKVDSLGLEDALDKESVIAGSVGVLKVKRDLKGVLNVTGGLDDDDALLGGLGVQSISKVIVGGNIDGSAGGERAGLLRVTGDIGVIKVRGSVIGGAEMSGIVVGGKVGQINIRRDLKSADIEHPVTISALGSVGATTEQKAVALKQLKVGGNVENAQILAGFRRDGTAFNGDAGIGRIDVGGNWIASSAAAGVEDATGDGYGINDSLIDLGRTGIVSRIASISIAGSATGSERAGDHFGITAEQIGQLTVGRTREPLQPGNGDTVSIGPDFTIVDFG